MKATNISLTRFWIKKKQSNSFVHAYQGLEMECNGQWADINVYSPYSSYTVLNLHIWSMKVFAVW